MTRDQIIALVRAKIDEINSDSDTNEVGDIFDIIDDNLEDSANDLLRKAPLWLCEATEVTLTGHIENSDGSGEVPLPDDFLRLYSFQMKDWDYPVTDIISEQNPKFHFRKNTYLKGRPWRPVVVVRTQVPDGVLKNTPYKILEYYTTLNETHNITRALYVKRHDSVNHDVTQLPDALMEGFAWQAAYNFFITVQQPEQAQAAGGKLQEFLTLNTK